MHWNRRANIAMVRRINPSTGIYSKKIYKSEVRVFSNKLLDLNSFEITVGSFNYPPYVEVKCNSTGHVSGSEALALAGSKAMK